MELFQDITFSLKQKVVQVIAIYKKNIIWTYLIINLDQDQKWIKIGKIPKDLNKFTSEMSL